MGAQATTPSQAGFLVGRVGSGVLLPGSKSQTCHTRCVTLGKSLNLSIPPFCHLYSGSINCTEFLVNI